LIKHAILQSASDIHIEPDEKEVRVRYRIDGILHDAMTLPHQVLDGLVARIKVLSNLKLDEHRLPQDGRFKIEKDGYKISFRVSMLPVFEGEKIVMRLLDETSNRINPRKNGVGRGSFGNCASRNQASERHDFSGQDLPEAEKQQHSILLWIF